jgi:hypothetical protein
LDGGQTWSPALTPAHVDYNSAVATYAYQTDTFPPVGTYNSVSNVPTRYLNGLIARNFRHGVPPPPGPKPPPCLTCPPDTYDFPTTLLVDVSSDGGNSFQTITLSNVITRATARHSEDTSDTRSFDTELLSFQVVNPPPTLSGMLVRESPSRHSVGKTTVQSVSGSPYRIGSFFDVFTEISLDSGATWSPANDPSHLELNPQPLPP